MNNYKNLLKNSLQLLFICSFLVVICYFYVDSQVAIYVHNNNLNHFWFPDQITKLPEFFVYLSVPVLFVTLVLRAFRELKSYEIVILSASISLMLATFIKNILKIVFSRAWGETWINNNPSLIKNDVYGFFPFHGGEAYGSFPSGHTAVTLAVMSVLWFAYPRYRWLYASISVAVIFSLVIMNYHFVGDCVAGFWVGSVTGMYCYFLIQK